LAEFAQTCQKNVYLKDDGNLFSEVTQNTQEMVTPRKRSSCVLWTIKSKIQTYFYS